jgi:hypothetical protein
LSRGAILSTCRPDLGDLTATSPPDKSNISGSQLASPVTETRMVMKKKAGVLYYIIVIK